MVVRLPIPQPLPVGGRQAAGQAEEPGLDQVDRPRNLGGER